MDIGEMNISDTVNEISMNDASTHVGHVIENKDTNKVKTKFWTGEETEYMISLYEENIAEVGPSKRFRIKKIMWMHIASIMVDKFNREFTGPQIENRYKGIARKKRNASIKQHKFTTHFDHEYEQFIDVNDSISQDDEEEIFSDRKSVKKTESTPTDDYYNSNSNHIAGGGASSPPPPPTFLFGGNNENIVLKYMQQQKEIFKEQEERKQKRHDEKMTVLKSIGESLQRLLERKRKYSG